MDGCRPMPEGARVLTDPVSSLRHLRLPVALTRLGMVAERVTRAFWPAWSVVFAALAPLIMGWQDTLPVELVWGFTVVSVVALVAALVLGLRRFRWPSTEEAVERVDARLPGRPLSALADDQAIGASDAASRAVWQAHMARMAERSRAARAVEPDLRVSRADPYGLRYIALLFFAAALLFGSLLRVGSVADMAPTSGQSLATGPVWEGWVEPPAYTGRPALYLADVAPGRLRVPEGSQVTLRLYGEVGALTVDETVSGRAGEDVGAASDLEQVFDITQSGRLAVLGDGGAEWEVMVIEDAPPEVDLSGPAQTEASGEMSLPFRAADDYAVVGGTATIELNLAAVDRRHGLTVDPDPREPLVIDLPMPFTGDRAEFEEALIDDFSEHPFANLPVTLTLEVFDARSQIGRNHPEEMILPGRRFFQPIARAVIEQRRDLMWSKSNASRVVDVLRAVSHRPEGFFRSETTYLRLRFILRRLDAMATYGTMTDEQQAEIVQALWDLAIQLEDGTLADARERLRRAQERLAEAMRNGASDEEIAELMQELREATDDYMRMLAENAEPSDDDGTDQPDQGQDSFEFSMDELQNLMDEIQRLMEEGRMAEAEALMEQLNQLLENMVVELDPNAQGGQGPGQQSMEDLGQTLRDQQGLSDEAFRDLQDQFNPGQQGQEQQGQQPGQQPGQQGGQQPGERQGQGLGQGDNPTDGQLGENGQGGENDLADGGEDGEGLGQSLADRQEALRRELDRQRQNLPNLGGEAAEEARRALEDAGRAMDGAEDALRDGDLPGAIDRQAEAMNALRDGLRNLGEALAENQQQEPGQGQQVGNADGSVEPLRRDPLGRQLGDTGQFGTDENMLQGQDVYRRAEELLDELRRRSADQERPALELDYLRRLLDRF